MVNKKQYFINKTLVCDQNNIFKGRVNFCKECSLFLPQSNSIMIKKIYKNELLKKINPNNEFIFMINNKNNKRYFNLNSFHIKFRPKIIYFIKKLCNVCNFSIEIFYLSVLNMDLILSVYSLNTNQISIFVILSILIVAKLKENQCKIPKIIDIVNIYKLNISLKQVLIYEKIILKTLNYNPDNITTYNFICYFLKVGIIKNNDVLNMFLLKHNDTSYDEFKILFMKKYENLLYKLCNLTVLYYQFNEYSSWAVSASCIAIANKLIGIEDYWNFELEEITYLSWEKIHKIANLIYCIYNKNNSKKNPWVEELLKV